MDNAKLTLILKQLPHPYLTRLALLLGFYSSLPISVFDIAEHIAKTGISPVRLQQSLHAIGASLVASQVPECTLSNDETVCKWKYVFDELNGLKHADLENLMTVLGVSHPEGSAVVPYSVTYTIVDAHTPKATFDYAIQEIKKSSAPDQESEYDSISKIKEILKVLGISKPIRDKLFSDGLSIHTIEFLDESYLVSMGVGILNAKAIIHHLSKLSNKNDIF